MKFLLLGIVASLAALALYPVVLSVGQRLAAKLKEVQDEPEEEETMRNDEEGI